MAGNQSVLIDLSSWYKDSLASKIELVRKAVDERRKLVFFFYSTKGESVRCIEPYYLIFRWSSWYVWGWCEKREDFRLFKLNRIEQLQISAQIFEARKVPMPDLSNESIFPGGIKVKALFEPECKWRLVDEFGSKCFKELDNGKLLFHADYTNRENLITWILTFRDKVELLEPEEVRTELVESMKCIWKKYEGENLHEIYMD